MTRFRTIGLFTLAAAIIASSASAQEGNFLDKLFGNSERLGPSTEQERVPQPGPPAQGRVAQGPGELMMRIDRLEAQIRQLTGAIEQLQYRNQQLEAIVRRIQGDDSASQRMQQPSRSVAPPVVSQPPAPTAPARRGDAFDPTTNPNAAGAPRPLGTTIPSAPLAQETDESAGAPGGRQAGAPLDLSTLSSVPDASLNATAGGELPPPPARNPSSTGTQVATLPPSDSPKDSFDLAYGYITRKDYALAEDGFNNFLRRFPGDRLAPDAQYWLGESLYQRQRFRDAAENFLNVSTKYENAAKAPDALLRLGQSLAALGEKEAACASFGEVLRKYPRASVSVKQGVDREQKRVRC
jgi:tol-pal system protein YbgF